jgi:peptidoglycan/LPS O-acetylase OafA/YrhL
MSRSALRSGIRIASLDAWRGLAALLVVTQHTVLFVIFSLDLKNNFLSMFLGLGNYGVQIFFVVSGLCVAQAAFRSLDKPAPVAAFIGARVRRIYPPYAIASVLSVLMSALAASLVARNILPSSTIGAERLFDWPAEDYLCSALLLQHVCHIKLMMPVFWTLCYEAAFYFLVAGALAAAVTFRRDRLILDLCHALTLASSAGLLMAPDWVVYPFDLWPEFGLGVLVFDILTLHRRFAFGILLGTVAMQAAYALPRFGSGPGYLPTPGMQAVSAIVFCLVLLAMHPLDARIARFRPVRLLSSVGVYSYSLYLSHWLTVGPLAQLFKGLHVTFAGSAWVPGLVLMAAAVTVAKLFYLVAERPFVSGQRRGLDQSATASVPVPATPPGDVTPALFWRRRFQSLRSSFRGLVPGGIRNPR